ncbi:hypothetical protein QBC38DRAFT_478430 [Podospora fimiseda]|uniref:Uncharacterized protein n=1 Tax=Podospora fimiseda TaxID=252190 RepID=A0AAN7BQ94_9PEZI|nr:hypothetical protein QBC38DRAFT_478430 [Podospora fimiseda]
MDKFRQPRVKYQSNSNQGQLAYVAPSQYLGAQIQQPPHSPHHQSSRGSYGPPLQSQSPSSSVFSGIPSFSNPQLPPVLSFPGVVKSPGNRFLAIGIDFGTTYCGVSWALSDTPDAIHEITEWPAEYFMNSAQDQVPTQLDLKTGKWGYEVTPNMKPIKWFKLLLLKDSDIDRDEIRKSVHLEDARKQLASHRPPLSPTDAVGMYLGKLWKHTYSKLGSMMTVDNIPLRVAITVPAIWPPYAEEAMRKAAAIAGITEERDIGQTTLDLVQEPEAAALSIFLDRRDLPEIQPRETFVVCDAGGGTVDVISYTVQSISPFHVGECVNGDGRLAGAYKVDEAFAAHLRWNVKLKIDSLPVSDHNSFVTKEWEMGAKRSFTGNPEPREFNMTPPAKAIKTRDRLRGKGGLVITKEAMAGFFDQSLTGIRSLISDQIKGVQSKTGKKPRNILLVGGLGGSQYIYNQLELQYPNQVLRPIRPWSAVAHGAVIRLLQDKMPSLPNLSHEQRAMISRIPEVTTRKARYSYGVVYSPYVNSLSDFDDSLDKVSITPEGDRCTSRMKWYLHQGDELSKKLPVLFKFVEFATASTLPQKCNFVIMYSQTNPPPKRKDSSVLELCRIECDWDKPFSEWKEISGTGNAVGTGPWSGSGWRKHEGLTLAMRFGGQPKFTLKVGHNEAEKEVKVEYSS